MSRLKAIKVIHVNDVCLNLNSDSEHEQQEVLCYGLEAEAGMAREIFFSLTEGYFPPEHYREKKWTNKKYKYLP